MNHKLKIHSAPFQSVKVGLKKAEYRLNDRGFELGDILTLQEWEPDTKSYTGDEISVIVTHIQTGYGIPEGYCMMSIDLMGVESKYSFEDYSISIASIRKNEHLTPAFLCLGLIGELGELVEEITKSLPPANTDEENEMLTQLKNFTAIATQIELLKKKVRKLAIPHFANSSMDEPNNFEELKEEMGGLLWYLSSLGDLLKIPLDTVAQANFELNHQRVVHNPNWMIGIGEKFKKSNS